MYIIYYHVHVSVYECTLYNVQCTLYSVQCTLYICAYNNNTRNIEEGVWERDIEKGRYRERTIERGHPYIPIYNLYIYIEEEKGRERGRERGWEKVTRV